MHPIGVQTVGGEVDVLRMDAAEVMELRRIGHQSRDAGLPGQQTIPNPRASTTAWTVVNGLRD